MNLHCPDCSQVFSVASGRPGTQVPCPRCRHPVTLTRVHPPLGAWPDIVGHVSALIARAAGVRRPAGFSLRQTFSQVLSHRSGEEIERCLAVGGPDTTPDIRAVCCEWPRPWMFFRALVLALAMYGVFVAAWEQFGNRNLIPGLILVGSFAVPLSTLVLFFEFNVRRNVSLYQVCRLVMVGGVLAMVLSLFMYRLSAAFPIQWLGPSLAGVVEEPAKLLALGMVVNDRRYRYTLNGLLLGAAVGAGFAAFESAGYAFRVGLLDGSLAMRGVLVSRGLLSPFSHVVWTGMSAAALWRVKGGRRFEPWMLGDARFMRVFAAAVLLHMIWDSGLQLPLYGLNVLLGAVAWVIVLGLIEEGLSELRVERQAAGMPR
ncbi:MAG TPA: PrsW family glutamic-type intramembrane protease [Steroidobacteraceae bacterium]|nr:PrsW family glutamic-type intramembrane protease [Steroidobacteraceae bacterium]